ncbi:MAG: AraC family transcriptional regulator [Sphingomonadales bacterium]|jgi:AraC-like DNA-binding protein|nr:AraC family transcriptional regulator [Sphingomonadales bacterium]
MTDVAFQYAWPAAPLRGSLHVYWEVTVGTGGPVKDLLLPYGATMRFPLAGRWWHGESPAKLHKIDGQALFHGLTDEARWIGGSGGKAFCIVLFPLFWSALPDARAADYANKVCPLSELIGARADDLHQHLKDAASFEERCARADRWFSEWLCALPPDPRNAHVAGLMAALNDPDVNSVAMLCARLDLPQARLARLALRFFGFPAKTLLRRERFLRMLFTMERRPYAEWPDFIDAQYVDQSHLIRDFKDFTGMAPGQYFDLERPILSVAAEAIRKFLAGEAGPATHAVRRINDDE